MASVDDLDILFTEDSVDALIGTETVPILFVEPGTSVATFDLVGVMTTEPQCIMKAWDAVTNEVDSGTEITILGVEYAVLGSPRHDGNGLALVTLTLKG